MARKTKILVARVLIYVFSYVSYVGSCSLCGLFCDLLVASADQNMYLQKIRIYIYVLRNLFVVPLVFVLLPFSGASVIPQKKW